MGRRQQEGGVRQETGQSQAPEAWNKIPEGGTWTRPHLPAGTEARRGRRIDPNGPSVGRPRPPRQTCHPPITCRSLTAAKGSLPASKGHHVLASPHLG